MARSGSYSHVHSKTVNVPSGPTDLAATRRRNRHLGGFGALARGASWSAVVEVLGAMPDDGCGATYY
jgi:hypothetical protein